MPIVPQYRAEGPAQPLEPAMENPNRERVDADTALRGLAQLSGAVRGVDQPLPNVPDDLGQASMQGLANAGQGLKNMGQAAFDLRERLAEIRDFRKVSEAQTEMDRLVGEHQEWTIRNPNDPTKWEPEFRSRIDKFKNEYLAGKELSPAAQRAITQRVETFGERHAIQVGVQAAKQEIGLARDAWMAEIIRAENAGQADTVASLVDSGVSAGLIPADRGEMIKFQSIDKIETDARNNGLMEVDTLLNHGDIDGARERFETIPFDSPEEKAYRRSELEKKAITGIVVNDIKNQAIEDPEAALRRLESGEDKELSAMQKHDLLVFSHAQYNEAREASLSDVIAGIDSGAIDTEEKIKQGLWGKEATEQEFNALKARMEGVFVEDAKKERELQVRVSNYKPADDPYGVSASATRQEIMLTMKDGPAKEGILSELDRRASGEPITIIDEAKQKAQARFYGQIEAVAEWKVPADEVEHIKKDGDDVYFVEDENVKEGDPNFYIKPAEWWNKERRGRLVQLSTEDEIKVKEKKGGVVEDIARRNEVYRAADGRFETLSAEVERGDITTYEDYRNRARELTDEDSRRNSQNFLELQKSAERGALLPAGPEGGGSGISGSLFPESRIEAVKARAAQIRGN